MKEARTQIAQLRAEGLTASMKSVEIERRGTWYRVFVGSYSSQSDAEKVGQSLKQKKLIESFVIANSSLQK